MNREEILEARPTEVTDLQLCQLACLDIYDPPPDLKLLEISCVFFAHTKIGPHDVIVFRGSGTKRDWLRDFQVLGPTHVEALGHVHRGFYTGLEDVLAAVLPQLGASVYVTGHSLGGGEAPIFSLMLARAGLTPRACIMFAPPRPGYEDFRDKLVMEGIELRAYHNDGDIVPDVPAVVLPFHPWAHVCPLFPISIPPIEGDRGLLRCHHGTLYYKGLKLLTGV